MVSCSAARALSQRLAMRMEAIMGDKSALGEVIACTATSKHRDQLEKDSVLSPLKAGGRSIFRALETVAGATGAAVDGTASTGLCCCAGESCGSCAELLSSSDMAGRCLVQKLQKASKWGEKCKNP